MRRILLAVTVLALAGCPFASDPLAEYLGLELTATSFAGWESDPSLGGTPATYVTFEVAGAGQSGDDAYRLEVLNMMVDGDFSGGVGGWVGSGGGLVAIYTGANQIDGNTLHVATASGAEQVDLNLGPGVVADGFLADAAYLLRFNYRMDANNSAQIAYSDGTSGDLIWTFWGSSSGDAPGAGLASVWEFSPPKVVAGEVYPELGPTAQGGPFTLTIGDFGVQNVYIDQIRLVRSDVRPGVRRVVLEDDLDLPLVSGAYVFSLYVKTDGTATTTANRYEAAVVTLTIRGGEVDADGEFSGSGTLYQANEVFAEDSWSSWTLLSVTTATMQIPVDTDWGIELSFAAGDTRTSGGLDLDAGSVLISSPSLQLLVE